MTNTSLDPTADGQERFDPSTASPGKAAQHLVNLTREMNALNAKLKGLKEITEKCQARIELAIENGDWPESSSVDGASVHVHRQTWFGPADGDHKQLTKQLIELGHEDLAPSTVNSSRLSSFCREYLDPDRKMPLRTRLLSDNPKAMPVELVDALTFSEKEDIRVTGAGNPTKEDS